MSNSGAGRASRSSAPGRRPRRASRWRWPPAEAEGKVLGGGEGVGVGFKADALWVGMGTEASPDPAGASRRPGRPVSRVRTALEGSRRVTVANGLALAPSIECESGRTEGTPTSERDWTSQPASRLRIRSPAARSTSASRGGSSHQAAGFAESGSAVSVTYDSAPSTPLGFTAPVGPGVGRPTCRGSARPGSGTRPPS